MTHYEVLGVAPTATPEEIKSAFRARARETHPDHAKGDPQAAAHFNQVKVAFDMLSDPARRRAYDRKLRPQAEGTSAKAHWVTSRVGEAAAAVAQVARQEGESLVRDLGTTAVHDGVGYFFDRLFGRGK